MILVLAIYVGGMRTMNKYKVYPRSKVEKLVIEFIEEHKIYAQYGKDSEGLFNVQFLVEEEIDDN